VNITDTVIDLIHIPRKFEDLGNVSMYSLLSDSGYFEAHSQISESTIREALQAHPETVDEWMRFSEDKRSNVGWYFRPSHRGYEVGYFSRSQSGIKSAEYFDQTEACAVFIKNEIEEIRIKGT
jgi:hypothetical protein